MLSVTSAELDDLRARLSATRWPTTWPLNGWDAGTYAAFTVIIPSLPGFAFSPQRPSMTDFSQTHELWHRLMRDTLGFERYAAQGGDLGAGITDFFREHRG